jgi:hypothetical protein
MLKGMKRGRGLLRWTTALAVALALLLPSLTLAAPKQFPDQTSNGSVGLQGTISTEPPKRGATITTPGNGAVFTNVPITVSGLCPANTLVKIFSNNVFMGSVFCQGGSYSIQINLFSGKNDLVARVFDALDQAGPDSNVVTVTFNDAQFIQFGTHVQLTSLYAVRGVPPNQELNWPIILSGGTGPYAISIDWGDGSPTDLLSQPTAGSFTIKHVYKSAGIYKIIVKATDKNGGTAFLQLVGQATGASQTGTGKDGNTAVVKTQVLWWPALAMLPLVFAAFWVGQRARTKPRQRERLIC